MGFLAPLMLWGSIAASVPIALHFFFRSRYRTVPWAAMKFLLASIEQTSRRLKFQELLLLVLRVTMLVLLAFALARPLSSDVRGAGQAAAVDAVFLFDTSMSMGGIDGAKSRLERAQDAALEILDKLPPHSTIQIITCADRADLDSASTGSAMNVHSVLGWLGPHSSGNRDQAAAIIKALKPTSLSSNLRDGLFLANAVLAKRSLHGNKEFYVFTDMQKTAWTTKPEEVKSLMGEIGQQASITVVRCGKPDFTNAAIEKVVLSTDVPRPGERIDFSVQVRHTAGDKSIKNLQLTLLVDGKEVEGQSKSLEELHPNTTETLTLTGKLDSPGFHTVTVLIKDGQDDVPGDNRYDYVVRVPDYYRVLIVDGGDNDPEDKDKASLASSFYLMHQFAPVDEKDYSRFHVQQTRVRARSAAASELTPASNLDKLDLCVLVNCKMPPLDAAEKTTRNMLSHSFLAQLKQYVTSGGSLLVYAGDKVEYQDYNQVFGDKYKLLPMALKTPPRDKKVFEFGNKEPMRLNRETFDLPAYRKFKYDKRFGDFNRIEIYKAFELDEPTRKEVRKDDDDKRVLTEEERKEEEKKKEQAKNEENITVILRYKNGWPAVVLRKVGEGEVVFITTSAEPGGHTTEEILGNKGLKELQYTWNNWGLNLMSGPFVKSTLAHLLAGASQDENFGAGKTFEWKAREQTEKSFTLYHPRPRKVAPKADDKADDDGKPEIKYERPPERLGLPAKDPETGKVFVKTNDLYRAGIYRLRAMNPADEGKVDESDDEIETHGVPLAVTCDLNETKDLETFKIVDDKNEEFDKFVNIDPPVRHLIAGSKKARSTDLDRLNREWTVWLLIALLVLALCEVGLAYWCGRSW